MSTDIDGNGRYLQFPDPVCDALFIGDRDDDTRLLETMTDDDMTRLDACSVDNIEVAKAKGRVLIRFSRTSELPAKHVWAQDIANRLRVIVVVQELIGWRYGEFLREFHARLDLAWHIVSQNPTDGGINVTRFLPEANKPDSVHSGHSVQQTEWKNLRLDALPDPAEFPLDVFPPTVKRLVEEVASSIGCPVDFPAAVALAVASVAIGQSCRLKLKNGYFTSASIWLAMIGPPSDGKSPSLDLIAQPIRDIDKRFKDEYKDKLIQWEQECIDAKKAKSPSPPKPAHTRIDVDDVTIEALTRIMNDSPHGVGWFCDEISGMILGLNMYKPGGRGNDRHTLNKWWSNKRSKRDRLNESGNAEWPFLTVAGGLVPDCLPDLRDRDGRATGFLERWLIVFPPSQPIPEWSWEGFDEELMKEWDNIINRLHNRSSEQEKQTIVDWKDDEARETWVLCYNAHVAEMNAIDFRDSLRGSWGKFREYAGRFCLVLSRLWREADTETPRDMSIDSLTIVGAWALVDYFKAGFLRAKRAIEGIGSGGGEDVNAIIRWITRERLTKFSERDLYREVGRFRKEKEAMESALAWLQSRCAIRPIQVVKEGPGRNPSPQWEVNPDLINHGQNGQIGQNSPD